MSESAWYESNEGFEAWLLERGLKIAKKKLRQGGGGLFVPETCPCPRQTQDGAFSVERFPSGKLGATCKHNHCQIREAADSSNPNESGWRAFRTLVDSGYDPARAEKGQSGARRGNKWTSGTLCENDSKTQVRSIARKASSFKRKPVEHIWPSRLAAGKSAGCVGFPGVGKGVLWTDLSSTITTGGTWPDGAACEAGGVVILTGEDDPEDTLVPRLEAAGADLDRVGIITTTVNEKGEIEVPTLERHLREIEYACRDYKAKLLVIDPLSAHLEGDTDSWRDQDMRAVLTPLQLMAARVGVAPWIIQHPVKSASGRPLLYAGSGSIGIVAACRMAFAVVEHPEQEGVRLLVPTKNNLSKWPETLAFTVDSWSEDPELPVVLWQGTSPITAKDLEQTPGRGREPEQLEEAIHFLLERLIDGPLAATQVYDAADAANISRRTLKRAKALLRIESEQAGFHGGWYWVLPYASGSSILGKNGHSPTECHNSNIKEPPF